MVIQASICYGVVSGSAGLSKSKFQHHKSQGVSHRLGRAKAGKPGPAQPGPETATKTRQHDLLRPRVGQKEPPRPGRTICYGQEWPERATKTRQYDLLWLKVARKSHQDDLLLPRDPAARFVAAKSGLEKATKTRQYDLLRPRMGQKKPARPASTICYGQVGQK